MSSVIIVGDYFSTGSRESETGVRVINHVTTSDIVRNKIALQSYLFSFLVEGSKAVHTAHNSITIDNEKFLLFLSGNYLMTEKIASSKGRFQSILMFFSQKAVDVFFSKYAGTLTKRRNVLPQQVQIFRSDEFLKNFIQSLMLISESGNEIPAGLHSLKLEELLLYLCHQHPEKMEQLKTRANISQTEVEITKLVESNIGSNITLDELAFLCNLSLSTFKRKFIKLYGVTPSKWFLQRRMELATTLLRTSKEKPSEIYYKVGYESHSSFTHSFKQVFGLTPSQYQDNT